MHTARARAIKTGITTIEATSTIIHPTVSHATIDAAVRSNNATAASHDSQLSVVFARLLLCWGGMRGGRNIRFIAAIASQRNHLVLHAAQKKCAYKTSVKCGKATS